MSSIDSGVGFDRALRRRDRVGIVGEDRRRWFGISISATAWAYAGSASSKRPSTVVRAREHGPALGVAGVLLHALGELADEGGDLLPGRLGGTCSDEGGATPAAAICAGAPGRSSEGEPVPR